MYGEELVWPEHVETFTKAYSLEATTVFKKNVILLLFFFMCVYVLMDQKILVWKKIKYSTMEDAEKRQLAQEVQLLQALTHTNIVR